MAEKPEKRTDVKLVKMVRDKPSKKDGPTKADVHPNEVKNYQLGGWSRAELRR